MTIALVMLMVEAGELGLDDVTADHLPPDLVFDTKGATIRQFLGHRSGIPDYYEVGQGGEDAGRARSDEFPIGA